MIYDLQKASILKRISAFLLDIILMLILVTGFAALISSILDISSDIKVYDSIMSEYEEKFTNENEWNLVIDFTNMDFEKLTEDQIKYIDSAAAQVYKDNRFLNICDLIFNKSLVLISLSLFFSFMILEFIVPLLFKNGQTVGKKIFSIAVMRIDGVKISPVFLFVRAILGKFTIETMIPAFILLMHYFRLGTLVTLAVLLLIPLFEIILVISTKTNSLIHDVLSSTVVVDLQSQMIFESVEAKEEYRLRIHNDDVKNSKYF